jgi:hypothetical protein
MEETFHLLHTHDGMPLGGPTLRVEVLTVNPLVLTNSSNVSLHTSP